MKYMRELSLLVLVVLPFAYLAYIWKELPENVPMHWNLNGEIDRYGDKSELWLIPILLPLMSYVLMLVVPRIDPKGKIQQMGNKYEQIKWSLTALMSVLALYILYASKGASPMRSNIVFFLVGAVFVLFGNFFKTIRPNYFIGIRTPWTLEDESVWRSTHALGGKLWFAGGIVIILGSLILDSRSGIILFVGVTTLLVLVPILYSYFAFKQLKESS